MAVSSEPDLSPRDDFDPRFYESLGTERPRCVSRFGGQTTGSDHDHSCEYDADPEGESRRCAEWVRGAPDPETGLRPLIKQSQTHECHCGQAAWVTGQASVLLAGTTIEG